MKNLLKKLLKTEEKKPKTYSDLIKEATCKEDLGLIEIKESANSAIARKMGPNPFSQGGVLFETSSCCGARVDYTTRGLIRGHCSKCKKPYEEPVY